VKIFAGGIATETNTFCPVPTSLDDFFVQRAGRAGASGSDPLNLDPRQLWGPLAEARGHEFVFGLMATAQPSGMTTASAYEQLRDELLERLRAALPVDVVLLMLHGAMLAQGYDDCEEDIVSCVRRAVGPATVIGVELDLHCNLRQQKIADADVVVTYKEYPHVDVAERAMELLELAVATRLRTIRPMMALFDCRMIGSYPTTREPLRGFVESMVAAEHSKAALSLSFAHGFKSADVPHLGASMLAVTDGDRAGAERLAREFGLRVYGLRRQIGFDSLSLPLEQALARALHSRSGTVVVADQSDNVGGGGPGDATFALRWLLDHDAADVAMGIFYDPQVVEIASNAGAGARLTVRLGGKMGPSSGDPIDLDVAVVAIHKNYLHAWPQQSGEPRLFPAGNVVGLSHGSIDIVVSSERCQCFSPSVFADFGVDLARKHLLIPKSNQHFYNAFAALAPEVIYMAGPGATPPDPRQLGYRRVPTDRLYPWVDDPLHVDK
jgi:microcystin degradation protein MlrC